MEVWARVIKFILKSFFCCSFKVYYQGGFLVKIFKMFGSFFLSFVICANVMGAATAPDCTDSKLEGQFAEATVLAQRVVTFWVSEKGSEMFELFAFPAVRTEIMEHLGGRVFGWLRRSIWRDFISTYPFGILLCEKLLTDRKEIFKINDKNSEDVQELLVLSLRPFFVPCCRQVGSMQESRDLVRDTLKTLNKYELGSSKTKEALAQMLQWFFYITKLENSHRYLTTKFNEDEIAELERQADEIKAQKS
jgi:hypothetical protein